MKLKFIETAVIVGLVAEVMMGASAEREAESVSDSVVRLHVVANSDSDQDQALKLQVRDAVLAAADALTGGCDNADDALDAYKADKSAILQAAEQAVLAGGFDYPVTIQTGTEYFETRQYDSFSLPAGRYMTLKVTIGAGEGHNWWCVVFPPLCMTASEQELSEEAMAAGLDDDDIALITGENEVYVLKFKIVELIEELKQKLS